MAKIDTNENYKDEKEIYFMLKIRETEDMFHLLQEMEKL